MNNQERERCAQCVRCKRLSLPNFAFLLHNDEIYYEWTVAELPVLLLCSKNTELALKKNLWAHCSYTFGPKYTSSREPVHLTVAFQSLGRTLFPARLQVLLSGTCRLLVKLRAQDILITLRLIWLSITGFCGKLGWRQLQGGHPLDGLPINSKHQFIPQYTFKHEHDSSERAQHYLSDLALKNRKPLKTIRGKKKNVRVKSVN